MKHQHLLVLEAKLFARHEDEWNRGNGSWSVHSLARYLSDKHDMDFSSHLVHEVLKKYFTLDKGTWVPIKSRIISDLRDEVHDQDHQRVLFLLCDRWGLSRVRAVQDIVMLLYDTGIDMIGPEEGGL